MDARRLFALGAVALCGAVLEAQGSQAQSVEEFYKGKTVILAIGSDVGGGYDTYGRIIARYLGKYIPGNPTIVPKNMPGGGGLTLLNHMYNVAPKDGTTIGASQQLAPFEPLLASDKSNAKFDPIKFQWLGSPIRFSAVAIAWHTSPVKTAEDLLTHELIVGSSGAASNSTNDAYVLRNILGFKFRVILGYPGGADIDLAMLRGETQGRANIGWTGFSTRNPDWIPEKKISILYQMGLEKHPSIPAEVPLILDFAKTPEDRQVLELKFASYGIGYPYMVPDGTPADRVAALRKALATALADPELIADANKQRIEIEPITGETIEAVLRKSFSAPKEVVARLVEASKLPSDIEKAKAVKVRSTLTAVAGNARSITFMDAGKSSKAGLAEGTKVTIAGAKAEANALKVGMACEISYFGNEGQAVSVACD